MRPRLTRPRMPYRIHWTAALEGHAYNAIRPFWPTLQAWYEWQDLRQEAMVVFLLCARRYAVTVDNPAWFMALYRKSWQNRLITLVRKLPQHSLLGDLESAAIAPDSVPELFEILESLPNRLLLVVRELTRQQRRFKVGAPLRQELRAALVGAGCSKTVKRCS